MGYVPGDAMNLPNKYGYQPRTFDEMRDLDDEANFWATYRGAAGSARGWRLLVALLLVALPLWRLLA